MLHYFAKDLFKSHAAGRKEGLQDRTRQGGGLFHHYARDADANLR